MEMENQLCEQANFIFFIITCGCSTLHTQANIEIKFNIIETLCKSLTPSWKKMMSKKIMGTSWNIMGN